MMSYLITPYFRENDNFQSQIAARQENQRPDSVLKKPPTEDEAFLDNFLYIHQVTNAQQRTPLKYILFVRTYLHIFMSSCSEIYQRKSRLQVLC